tara:strand:+ start:57 stop:236 length:180 start_codon:yes stop_codon:yes gene_type:complete
LVKIERTKIPKPIITIVGANRILLKLKISLLKKSGLSLPPPLIKMNPRETIDKETNIKI